MEQKVGAKFTAYRCQHCGEYHTGKRIKPWDAVEIEQSMQKVRTVWIVSGGKIAWGYVYGNGRKQEIGRSHYAAVIFDQIAGDFRRKEKQPNATQDQ